MNFGQPVPRDSLQAPVVLACSTLLITTVPDAASSIAAAMVETGFSYGVQQKGSLRPSSFREGLVWACFLIHVGRSLAVRKELPDEYGSALGQLYRFAEQQLYVAPPNATVPTPTALRFNFGRDLYKLEKCERKNVANCLYYGENLRSILLRLL